MQKELLAIFRMTLDIQRNNYSIYQNPWQFLYQTVQAITHHSYYVIYYYKLFALILKFDFVNVLLLAKFEIKFTHTSFLCNILMGFFSAITHDYNTMSFSVYLY